MKIAWNSRTLSEALAQEVENQAEYGEVKFNSQDINPGDIFIALTIGNRDGHIFAQDAIDRGAGLVIASKQLDNIPQSKLLLVADSMEALDKMARYKRSHSKAKFIAITGSVGKTTTKEILKLALSSYGVVAASKSSFNNYLGVRVTLASIPLDAEYVVAEVGMNKAGEIAQLVQLICPHIAVITCIAEGHIGFFNSVQDIADAKCEIFSNMSENGIAVLSSDDHMYSYCKKQAISQGVKNIVSCGAATQDQVYIKQVLEQERGFSMLVEIDGHSYSLEARGLPPYFSRNFALSLGVVNALGKKMTSAVEMMSNFEAVDKRAQMLNVSKDGRKYQILCDYYNSNPTSLRAALNYFAGFEHDKKMAILADMRELGQFEDKLHEEMLEPIMASGVKKLLLVGHAMSKLASKIENIETFIFDNTEQLCQSIMQHVSGEEMILIKGSRGFQLEKVAQILGVKN